MAARRYGSSGLVTVVVLVWLLIGAFASVQRGYFRGPNQTCAHVGTIAVTIVAGPLNYVGLNPKVHSCKVPQPSQ